MTTRKLICEVWPNIGSHPAGRVDIDAAGAAGALKGGAVLKRRWICVCRLSPVS
jgi:hypothetical protein